jgi:hypothetical protein
MVAVIGENSEGKRETLEISPVGLGFKSTPLQLTVGVEVPPSIYTLFLLPLKREYGYRAD